MHVYHLLIQFKFIWFEALVKKSVVGALNVGWETTCQERALKSMTWCNKFGIHYLFNDVPVSLYQSLFDVLYFMSIFACIFCIVYNLGALRVAKKI